MTRILPILPMDLTKAPTHDLLNYLNTKIAEHAEKGDDERDYDEKLSEITTELIRRHDV